MNRKERKGKLSAFRRELKTAIFDDFVDITTPEVIAKFSQLTSHGRFLKFLRNSIYSVQIYSRNNLLLLGIRRHDEKPSCPWAHKLEIKNRLVGPHHSAIEVIPKSDEVVNSANIYWLWAGKEVEALCSRASLVHKKSISMESDLIQEQKESSTVNAKEIQT